MFRGMSREFAATEGVRNNKIRDAGWIGPMGIEFGGTMVTEEGA